MFFKNRNPIIMVISADEFLKSVRQSSKMDPFKNDIIKLRQAKVSYKDIIHFLEMNDIKTSVSNLCYFIKKTENEPPQLACESKNLVTTA